MIKSIHRTTLTISLVFLCVFINWSPNCFAGNLLDELVSEKKEEFDKEFERFKKEGLTAEEVKQLTDQLLEWAGDDISGTGTETLLKTLNTQADNALWIMEKKESAEKLIDFVGDVYALASSDAPPDPVGAYKALGKGVELSVQLAEKMPVMKVAAVPMLKAYSQAIKNGQKHIEAIASATEVKNRAIELGWRSMDYDELYQVTDLEVIEYEEPTIEELQWEEDRIKRQEEFSKYLKQCRDKFLLYDKVSTNRAKLWIQVENKLKELNETKIDAKSKGLNFKDNYNRYKDYRRNFLSSVEKHSDLHKKVERFKNEGNEQSYSFYKDKYDQNKVKLQNWKKKLFIDYNKISRELTAYREAVYSYKLNIKDYRSLLSSYKNIDANFQKAKSDFENCLKLAESQPESIQLAASGETVIILEPGSLWEYTFSDPTDNPSWNSSTGNWTIGAAPFGSRTNIDNEFSANTIWEADDNKDYDLWVRTSINLSQINQASLKWHLGVDNGFILYVNGILIDSGMAEGFTHRWEYSGEIPENVLKKGDNIIAVALEDHGGETAFDMQITGIKQ